VNVLRDAIALVENRTVASIAAGQRSLLRIAL
jgi:hypothetical protein